MPISPAYRGNPAITIYGASADLAALVGVRELSTGHSVIYAPTPKMKWEAGSTAFGCAAVGGAVIVGALTATGNSFTESFINSTFHVFQPRTGKWSKLIIRSDMGFRGVLGSDGFGTGDWWVFVVVGGQFVAISSKEYSDWVIATYGRYPAWMKIDPTTKAISNPLTIPQLKAAAVDGNEELSWPDLVNVHAETYASNMLMASADVLVNGWTVIGDYIGDSYAGQVKVLDTDGVQQGFYAFPDMQTEDGELLQMCPVSVHADPTSGSTDMRFVVCFDVFLRGGISHRPFMFMEMSCDNTGVIAPVSAPVGASYEDETPDWSDNEGMAGGTFGPDGTFWMTSGSREGFGFGGKPMGVWFKTGGERRWVAENPPSAGWENRLGENRMVPDFEIGVVAKSSSHIYGTFFDPVSGGVVTVGFGGRVFPWVPDKPLALRAAFKSNCTFVSNITGWAAYGGSGTATWEATDGGRLKMVSNGTGVNLVWQTDSGSTYTDLPANSVGQSFWGWARLKANTTLRTVRCSLIFYNNLNVSVGTATGANAIERAGVYTKATVAAEVPATAVKVKMYVSVVIGVVNGETHYSDEAYLGIAPVTHKTEANLDLTSLPKGTADVIWPSGIGINQGVDSARSAWLPIRIAENTGTAQPAPMPQYLARLNLPMLLDLYHPTAAARRTGPTNPLRQTA